MAPQIPHGTDHVISCDLDMSHVPRSTVGLDTILGRIPRSHVYIYILYYIYSYLVTYAYTHIYIDMDISGRMTIAVRSIH